MKPLNIFTTTSAAGFAGGTAVSTGYAVTYSKKIEHMEEKHNLEIDIRDNQIGKNMEVIVGLNNKWAPLWEWCKESRLCQEYKKEMEYVNKEILGTN